MNKKGFTLIELLIVITIIGVLAVALVPRIAGIPAKGRDAARIASLNQIVTGLESYYSENGNYPANVTKDKGDCLKDATGNPGALLKSQLGGSIPADPSATREFTIDGVKCTGNFHYRSLDDGNGFLLVTDTEGDGKGAGYYLDTELTAAKFKKAKDAPSTISTIGAGTDGPNNVYAIIR